MSNYRTTMTAKAWAQPNIELAKPNFVITVEWTWPTGDYWSRFQIVRSIRSPAMRVEEGYRMLTPLDGLRMEQWNSFAERGEDLRLDLSLENVPPPPPPHPTLLDPQPPPDEWVYYTLFVLDANRVWVAVGNACDIGTANYGWGLRLPELLPGVAVSGQSGVVDPADQDHDLVQFLQGPSTALDVAVTMAEAAQFFWSPHRVPPQMLGALGNSWGYQYSEAIGIGRNRDVLDALRTPAQGSMAAIREIVIGAMGSFNVITSVANNLMLDVNDSSFESGKIEDTGWWPRDLLEVRDYNVFSTPIPILPLSISKTHFLHIDGAATIKCGYNSVGIVEPATRGIPVADWTKFRMGCYAFDEVGGANTRLSLGMDFYSRDDKNPKFLGSITALDNVLLNNLWNWYDLNGGDTVPIADLSVLLSDEMILIDDSRWQAMVPPAYTGTQSLRPVYISSPTFEYLRVQWNTAPQSSTNTAFWGVSSTALDIPITVGSTYTITMKMLGLLPMSGWRPAVSNGTDTLGAPATFTYGGGTEEEDYVTAEFIWVPASSSGQVWFGVEAERPASGWASVTEHLIHSFEIREGSSAGIREGTGDYAYGVPWVTVSDACSIDLLVVDDG